MANNVYATNATDTVGTTDANATETAKAARVSDENKTRGIPDEATDDEATKDDVDTDAVERDVDGKDED